MWSVCGNLYQIRGDVRSAPSRVRALLWRIVPAHTFTFLSAKACLGGKDKLAALQTEFHEAAGVRHGVWMRLEEIEAVRANLEVLRVGFYRDHAALDQDR